MALSDFPKFSQSSAINDIKAVLGTTVGTSEEIASQILFAVMDNLNLQMNEDGTITYYG